ncbi:hemerythrin domain-containing protein [Brevundimonas sp. UBA7506]|uniref:hemerythrin domain-containing protein n=1 Tax=Brevundimonas sp. UBA7506 TaxID=1946136 RepID=UPI0025C7225B|nr:hemerythrin domain-containing protein [Brevundimonas sp. UBA7506]
MRKLVLESERRAKAGGKEPRAEKRLQPVAPRKAKADAVAKARVVAPDLAARIGSTPATKFRGDPDIFGRLVEDHDRHRALLAMLEETKGKSPDRERLFVELVHELKAHAAAEEQALWSSVLRNPATTDFARHAVAEHKEIDDLLADLAARDMASPGWIRRFAALREEYLHHIREEEQEQFVAAEEVLSLADRRFMRTVFNRRKQEEKAAAEVEKKIRLKA